MTSLTFHDRMEGYVSFTERDLHQALLDGRRARRACAFDVDIDVDDVERFLRDPHHVARLRGRIDCEELGGRLAVDDGVFNLFFENGGERRTQMRYRLFARDRDGREMTLSGFKEIADSPNFDVWTDTTTLFVSLLAGRVEAADEERATVVARGILRISALGFVRLLTSIRPRGGTPSSRARALRDFAKLFAGRLWRVYGRTPLPGHQPDFLDPAGPDAARWDGHPPGTWHETPKLPGLVRRIVPFEAGDGMRLTLHNVRRREEDEGRVPVLLIHGTGVRANLFYGAPGRPSLVRTLVDEGFDVWLENWRGSIDFAPNQYTLDQAALHDHPRALEAVQAHTGADTVRVLCHCQGSTGFVITALAGLAPQVDRVVSSAVSLHPVVSWSSRIKLTLMVPLVGTGTPYVSAQWGARPPSPLAQLVAFWARLLRRECDDPVCALANYMYGTGPDVLWRHANLDPDTHHWTSREFGYAPVSFLKQIGASVRAGHLVNVERLPGLPGDYAARPKGPIHAPWTFIAGSRNNLFQAESQRRTFDWFDELEPGRHALHVIDGYGHLDLLFGREAKRDVHPTIVAALRG